MSLVQKESLNLISKVENVSFSQTGTWFQKRGTLKLRALPLILFSETGLKEKCSIQVKRFYSLPGSAIIITPFGKIYYELPPTIAMGNVIIKIPLPFTHRPILQYRRYIWPGRGPLPVCGLLQGWKDRPSLLVK